MKIIIYQVQDNIIYHQLKDKVLLLIDKIK